MENKTFGRSIIVSATTKDDTKTISAEAANIPKDNTSQSSSSMAHLITLSGQQVVDKHELSVEQVLERCIEIDYETMENLTEDSEGCLNQWVEIFYAFPETWYMLMNDDEIVGYWHFVCLNDENFEKSKTGELLDGDVTIDTIEHMFLPGSYKGYFIGIAILPKYRNVKNLQLLLNAFIEQIEIYAEHDIYFVEWCANAFTKEGKAMCKSLKMEKLCDNKLDGEMYYARFSTMMELRIVQKSKRLVDLYNNYFSELI